MTDPDAGGATSPPADPPAPSPGGLSYPTVPDGYGGYPSPAPPAAQPPTIPYPTAQPPTIPYPTAQPSTIQYPTAQPSTTQYPTTPYPTPTEPSPTPDGSTSASHGPHGSIGTPPAGSPRWHDPAPSAYGPPGYAPSTGYDPAYGPPVPPAGQPAPPFGPQQSAFGPQGSPFGAQSAAPAGGYGAGGYGVDAFGMPVPTKVDTLANVSMGVGIGAAATGVFGCCCGPLGILALLGGVAGLVLGLLSRRNISAAGGRLAGRGQSLAGIITGAVGVVLGIGWVVLTVIGFSGALAG